MLIESNESVNFKEKWTYVLKKFKKRRDLRNNQRISFLELTTEAATETVFQNVLVFFQEQLFYNFPGGSICSSNRHEFSGGSICSSNRHSNRHVFFRRVYYVLRTDIFSHRTDIHFPGSPNLLLEHMLIFRRPLCLEHQSSAYEACDRTRKPPHTLKRLKCLRRAINRTP